MSANIYDQVKKSLQHRLIDVVQDLLPGGKISGKEYCCSSLRGGNGNSCRTNLATGVGSDFATGESWGDIIDLAACVWRMCPYEAASELCARYSLTPAGYQSSATNSAPQLAPAAFTPILPVPAAAPPPPRDHPQHGTASALWHYSDEQGRTLAYTARFDLPDSSKAILPLCYGRKKGNSPQWHWKALPKPRPLYGLEKLASMPGARVISVEGEKTADAAQVYFPDRVATTWSGGANAVDKTDHSPEYSREVAIWPDNDEPGFRAALNKAKLLAGKADVAIVLPPDILPEGWDLADQPVPGFDPAAYLATALPVDEFARRATLRFPNLGRSVSLQVSQSAEAPDAEEIKIKEWPEFSAMACPGILGEFVRLATRDSEADPAAIAITTLVRFCAEVFGHAPGKGPHISVGETIHPPRLFAVICGNTSKSRKGTSRHPVTKLFSREHCPVADLQAWDLPLPAKESGGPLSTGEGLAFHVRDVTDEERERRQRQNPNEPMHEQGDKRLIILDEEFASALTCTKRVGNTLSMAIRCFWDSGDYAPLTKSNPITVRGAHINIVTHITTQELAVCLGEIQAVNGFGNRFLWICARRSKLVALPARMPAVELAPLQRELWRLAAQAQQRGAMNTTPNALELWESIYPELSREHIGLAGSIINRAEAQTLRLALVYALLDGQGRIDVSHLQAALAMWRYAQDSALYIFGDQAVDPLESKILRALQNGPLTATELNRALSGHVPKERLQPLLQRLEAQQRISIASAINGGRPKVLFSLRELCVKSGKSEIR